MITTELSAIQRNNVESKRIAQAVAEFERSGGRIRQGDALRLEPKPPRRGWVDPETILKRKRSVMSRRDRNALKAMTEAL